MQPIEIHRPHQTTSRRALPILLLVLLFWTALSPGGAAALDGSVVEGRVVDAEGLPVADATVTLVDGEGGTSDADGRFELTVPAGERRLEVAHPLHGTLVTTVSAASSDQPLELRLPPLTTFSDSLTVTGIRAREEVPITTHEMTRTEIEETAYGQDVPALLENTPSLTWYSDSGIGTNYSYFSLRGIQQSRINITFDGAPLNDPAEHVLYFNNFHDFISTVDSIQIQRGVGTSTVGAPSYGGSVNFASRLPPAEQEFDARLVYGSYDTTRASVGYRTGVLDNGLWASGRVSWAETDGYRDHSGSEHRTLFLNAGWQGERSSLKLVSFSGDEESQLAFLAVEPEILDRDRTFNPLDEEERDDFGQDFAQLKYTRELDDRSLITASVYYNGASGIFRLWDDPVAQNELLDFGIDQSFVGTMVTYSRSFDRLDLDVGAHFNDFAGDHTLDVGGQRLYLNTGYKQTANAFAKAEYELGAWLIYGDLQLRWAEFEYEGDLDLGSVDWTFVDPKIGVRRRLSPSLSLYASVGQAQREPSRLDLLKGEDNATVFHDLEAVKPERVIDWELGVDLRSARLALQANLYAMEFSDEIALTGELSEVGLPLRRNVEDSYRRGLEVDLRWQMTPSWTLLHNANLSRNRISEWTQFYDVYDAPGNWVDSEPLTYRDVPPLLTPEVIVNLGAEWSGRIASAGVIGKYVDDSHLDNTGLDAFRLPSFTNVDLRAAVSLARWLPAARPRVTLYVNNLLDSEDQYPSGYSYQFLNLGPGGSTRLDGIRYFYPRATRNAVLSLELDF